MSLKLNQLRDFLAVAQTGSLRAAARELGVGQPSLTKSIQALERELNAPLFVRGATGAVLTTQGEAYLPRAQLVMAELERGREAIAQMGEDCAPEITLGFCPTSCALFLAPLVQALRARYPDIAIKIVEDGHSLSLLRNGELDFVVSLQPLPGQREDLEVENLLDCGCNIYCRPAHPMASTRTLSSLLDEVWIKPAVVGRPPAEFENAFERLQLAAPSNLIAVDNTFAGFDLILRMDALCLAPRELVESTQMAGQLAQIAVADLLPIVTVCLIQSSRLPLTPVAEFAANQVRRRAIALRPPPLSDLRASA